MWGASHDVPTVLVAIEDGVCLGSVNLLRSEMTIRPALTPWLAQLFVVPDRRRGGAGTALAAAAIDHARGWASSTSAGSA